MPRPPVLDAALALMGSVVRVGGVEHRVAVTPPLPADPPPAGEEATGTTMIAGSRVVSEPRKAETAASPLPIDLPVSVWRRGSDGVIHRGEARITTPLPWWQRFPADIGADLLPIDAHVSVASMMTLAPVEPIDRQRLVQQAAQDGYARLAPDTPSGAAATP
jgi:hypothetical protein